MCKQKVCQILKNAQIKQCDTEIYKDSIDLLFCWVFTDGHWDYP